MLDFIPLNITINAELLKAYFEVILNLAKMILTISKSHKVQSCFYLLKL